MPMNAITYILMMLAAVAAVPKARLAKLEEKVNTLDRPPHEVVSEEERASATRSRSEAVAFCKSPEGKEMMRHMNVAADCQRVFYGIEDNATCKRNHECKSGSCGRIEYAEKGKSPLGCCPSGKLVGPP